MAPCCLCATRAGGGCRCAPPRELRIFNRWTSFSVGRETNSATSRSRSTQPLGRAQRHGCRYQSPLCIEAARETKLPSFENQSVAVPVILVIHDSSGLDWVSVCNPLRFGRTLQIRHTRDEYVLCGLEPGRRNCPLRGIGEPAPSPQASVWKPDPQPNQTQRSRSYHVYFFQETHNPSKSNPATMRGVSRSCGVVT